ncbi:MAG: AAA family ATPase [Spirochaetes bacterium]|nr:AAA family ATPase [Spirochaetota bacterium]
MNTHPDIFDQARQSISPSIISRLFPGGEWKHGEYWIQNPLRNDKNPGSFSISESGLYNDFSSNDQGDMITLLEKFQGISKIEAANIIVEAAGHLTSDTFHSTPVKQNNSTLHIPAEYNPDERLNDLEIHLTNKFIVEKFGKAIAVWNYRFNKRSWVVVIRHEKDGKKNIVPYYFTTAGKWTAGNPKKNNRPLYNIDKFTVSTLPIIIVEGEKCAEVQVPGYITVTWIGGSQAVNKTDWKPLRGHKTIIWPDNDLAGFQAAEDIKAKLPHAEVLQITGKPKGWDIADAQSEGLDLVEYIKTCPRMKTKNTEPNFKVWTAAELITTDFPEPIYIIPGIIPQGLTVLAGTPKIGKSWFGLDIAITMSMGGTILGSIPIPLGRTLSLFLEDTPRRIKNRLKKQSAVPSDNCHIMTNWAPDGKGFIWLHKWMDEHPDTTVIIIDTLARFTTVKDNNDYSQTTAALTPIKAFADEYGIAIIVVHHAKKAEVTDFIHAAVGSIGITGVADTVLILARKRGQGDAVLSITGRDIEERELAVRFDTPTCRWEIVGDATEIADSKARQEIIDTLRAANGSMKPKDIAQVLNKNQSTTRFLLMKMCEAGQIIRSSRGEYQAVSTKNTNNTNDANNTNNTNNANTLL